MNIKNIRKKTGLSQAVFSKKYNIPLSTIKSWESSPESSNHRECPDYVKEMLKRITEEDFPDSKKEG